MKNLKKIITECVILCVLLITSISTVVFAEDVKHGKLTITCRTEEIVLENMEWNIHKVADITSNKKYELTGEYEHYPVRINGLNTSQMQAAAETLEAYTKIDNIKYNKSGKTDSKGRVVFENLDFGLYLISGKPVTVDDMFYIPTPSLVILDKKGNVSTSWSYDVNSMPKLKVLPTTMRIYDYDCSVKKLWSNDDEKTRPQSITAVLYKDGKEFFSVELNENNNWEYKWENLSTNYEWTVAEKDVPKNYTVTYTKNELEGRNEYENNIEYIINNTYDVQTTEPTSQPPTNIQIATQTNTQTTSKITQVSSINISSSTSGTTLPQTGQLWWPVPVLSASGLIVFGTGWKLNSHKRKK